LKKFYAPVSGTTGEEKTGNDKGDCQHHQAKREAYASITREQRKNPSSRAFGKCRGEKQLKDQKT